MTIKIRGFILPALLVKFLEDGIWTEARSITIPNAMLVPTGIDYEVTVYLYSLKGLELDNDSTYFDKMSDESFASIKSMCAWESSKKAGKAITDVHKLDIDYGICIASHISDDAIYLDYRIDENNPRVLIMNWSERKWCILALDFDTFARGIGLID